MSFGPEKTQTITYWAGSGFGNDGSTSFAAPSSIKGRWEDRSEKFMSSLQSEEISTAVVFLDQDVSPGDYLYLGTSTQTNPLLLSDAHKVEGFSKIPDLRAVRWERKAWLM